MSVEQELFDETVRVETLLWLPGTVADVEGAPDTFSEGFIEELPESDSAALYQQLPALATFANGDEYPDAWLVAEALQGTPGFLVKAATPVRKYGPEGDSYATHSWGHYATEWLYAPSEADIAKVALAWARQRAERWKAKAQAAA